MANKNYNGNDRPYGSDDEWEGQQGGGSGYGHGNPGYGNGAYNSSTDRNYSPNSNRQDWGRGRVDSGMGNGEDYSFNDRRFGQSASEGRFGSDTNRYRPGGQGGYGQQSGYNQQGGYGDQHGGGRNDRNDRSWWDRTKNELSSLFGGDDNDRSRGESRIEGGHRGRGPKDYQRSEDRIREDVCDRLADDDYVDASDIQVQVTGNEVVLSGHVRSREQKRRAEDVVERVSGVRHVENRIRVEVQPASNDRNTRPQDDRNQPW